MTDFSFRKIQRTKHGGRMSRVNYLCPLHQSYCRLAQPPLCNAFRRTFEELKIIYDKFGCNRIVINDAWVNEYKVFLTSATEPEIAHDVVTMLEYSATGVQSLDFRGDLKMAEEEMKERGMEVPQEVKDALEKLDKVKQEHRKEAGGRAATTRKAKAPETEEEDWD